MTPSSPTLPASSLSGAALPRREFLSTLSAAALLNAVGRTAQATVAPTAGTPSPVAAPPTPGAADEPLFYADPGWAG